MATTIRVDPDDELPAILDRLPTRDVCILVLPPHARALNSVVGAKLLARRAQALETHVAVVSEDRAVAAHVRAAGIPVAESVAEAARLLPAKLLFDDAAPLTPRADEAPALAPRTDETPLANGARPPAPHEELTLPHPVVEPLAALDSPDDSRLNDGTGNRAGDTSPQARTYRFVARQPNAPAQAATDAPAPAATQEEGDMERPPVRGHSGGARAARKSARPWGSGTSNPAGAGGASSASSTSGVYTAGATSRATSSATSRAGGGRSGARPAARPARLWDLLNSEGLTRVLVPALLGLVLLLLLLWLIVSVLGAVFNPTATLIVQARAVPIAAANPVVVHTYTTTLPPRKRIGPYTKLFFANKPEEGSVTLPTNGTRTLPGAVAGGQLVLRNMFNRPITVPAGAAFTTSLNSHTFVTTRDVTVPAARITFNGADYGKATAPIKAAVGGTAGNVPARTIGNVPAGFIGSLSVTNTVATSGGTDLTEKVPLQSDVDAAASKLFARLEARARQDIAALAAPAGAIEQHTLFVARSSVAPRVNGAPATARTATLTLSVVLHAAYVRQAGLQQVARTALGPQPHLLSGSVAYTARWQPDNSIVVAASARTVPPIDPDAIKAAINGQPTESAKAYLDHQTTINIATYHLTLAPIWANHVPSDVTRIHITVQPPQ